jgi:hypothetical protein
MLGMSYATNGQDWLNRAMRAVVLIALVLLSGCTTKFNQGNYDRMINVVVNSRDAETICAGKDSMKSAFDRMRLDTIYVLEDSTGRSDKDVMAMTTELLDEIDRFETMLAAGQVSPFFCKQKIVNVHDTAKLIAKEEGNKLKLP